MDSVRDHLAVGFPHSEICGSKPARGSPQLIAACYVLHRLSVPRHPRNALIALDRILRRGKPDIEHADIQRIHQIAHNTRPKPGAMCARSEKPIHDDKEQASNRTPQPFDLSRRQGRFPSKQDTLPHPGHPIPAPPKDGGASRDRTDDLKLAKLALSQLSYGPVLGGPATRRAGPGRWHPGAASSVVRMVGPEGFEPSTPRLSSVCSNQLSYRPLADSPWGGAFLVRGRDAETAPDREGTSWKSR